MIGLTLGFYFAARFVKVTFMIFALFFGLIVVVDLIELSRQAGQIKDAAFSDMLTVSLLRAPSFAENVLPFAVMFGGATTLIILNRKLELVVARASGVSVWQFLFPLVLAAMLLGLTASLVYNPLSINGHIASSAFEAKIFGSVKGGFSNTSKNSWVRLGQKNGDVVIRAKVSQNGGELLTAVSTYQFNSQGEVIERIDAEKARFVETKSGDSHYLLENAVRHRPGERSEPKDKVTLPVNISLVQLQADQADIANVSIWEIDDQILQAKSSNKSPLPFSTRYHALLSQPLLFVAMVLLAATVSLRFARFGINSKAILGGILAGFVLYVLSKLVITFGSNGLVPASLAAWTPAIVASLIGVTVLLYQEDG